MVLFWSGLVKVRFVGYMWHASVRYDVSV